MKYTTATNPQTGDTMLLDNGQWLPVTSTASHPSGAKAYQVNGQWLTESPDDYPQPSPEEVQAKANKQHEDIDTLESQGMPQKLVDEARSKLPARTDKAGQEAESTAFTLGRGGLSTLNLPGAAADIAASGGVDPIMGGAHAIAKGIDWLRGNTTATDALRTLHPDFVPTQTDLYKEIVGKTLDHIQQGYQAAAPSMLKASEARQAKHTADVEKMEEGASPIERAESQLFAGIENKVREPFSILPAAAEQAIPLAVATEAGPEALGARSSAAEGSALADAAAKAQASGDTEVATALTKKAAKASKTAETKAKAGTAGTFGLQTAQGAAQQAQQQILSLDDEQKRKQSPRYAKLRDSGMSEQDATDALVKDATTIAEQLGFAVGTIGGLALPGENTGKLAAAAGVEGSMVAQAGATQAASNLAQKASGANPDQSVTEGVPEAMGQAAVSTLPLAGVTALAHGKKVAAKPKAEPNEGLVEFKDEEEPGAVPPVKDIVDMSEGGPPGSPLSPQRQELQDRIQALQAKKETAAESVHPHIDARIEDLQRQDKDAADQEAKAAADKAQAEQDIQVAAKHRETAKDLRATADETEHPEDRAQFLKDADAHDEKAAKLEKSNEPKAETTPAPEAPGQAAKPPAAAGEALEGTRLAKDGKTILGGNPPPGVEEPEYVPNPRVDRSGHVPLTGGIDRKDPDKIHIDERMPHFVWVPDHEGPKGRSPGHWENVDDEIIAHEDGENSPADNQNDKDYVPAHNQDGNPASVEHLAKSNTAFGAYDKVTQPYIKQIEEKAEPARVSKTLDQRPYMKGEKNPDKTHLLNPEAEPQPADEVPPRPEKKANAQEVREDAGQVQEGRTAPEGRKEEGGDIVQQPAEARAKTGNAERVEAPPPGEPAGEIPMAHPDLKGNTGKLEKMAKGAGWKSLKHGVDVTGAKVNEAVPNEPWFADVQREAKLPKNSDGSATREAVRKAVAGEPMTGAERAHVKAMLEWKPKQEAAPEGLEAAKPEEQPPEVAAKVAAERAKHQAVIDEPEAATDRQIRQAVDHLDSGASGKTTDQVEKDRTALQQEAEKRKANEPQFDRVEDLEAAINENQAAIDAKRNGPARAPVKLRRVPPPNEASRAMSQLVRRLFGREVVFFKSDRVTHRGAYLQGDRLFVNVDAPKPLDAVIGHELLHSLRNKAPAVYDKLVHALGSALDTEGMAAYKQELVDRGYRADLPEKLHEEMIADILSDHFVDPKFIEQVRHSIEEPLFKRLAQHMLDFLDRIRGKLPVDPKDLGRVARGAVADIEAARKALKDALIEYGKSEKESGTLKDDAADFSREEEKVTKSPEFKKWFGESKVVDEKGEPRVMYHGSTRWDKDGQQLGDINAFDRLATNKALGRKPGMDTVGSWFSSEPGKEGAGMYTPDTGVMYPVYLSIKKPWRPKNFDQFLDFMHQSEGRDPKKQNPRGAGSTEGLRKELKAMGYDGIQFNRGDLSGAKKKLAAAEARLKRTEEDYFRGGQSKAERAENKVMLANAERNVAAARKYLSEQDAEFEKQDVWVAFEPEQIKSAIGNKGTFDPSDSRIDYSRENLGPDYEYGERVTGIKHATVDQEREERGLPPLESEARKGFEQSWDEAAERMASHPEAVTELVRDLLDHPKPATDVENAMLLRQRVNLHNNYHKAMAIINDPGTSEADVREYSTRVAKMEDEINDLDKAMRVTGTAQGRALVTRRMMAKEDFTLASMMQQRRAANDGKALTPEQKANTEKLHQRIAELEKELRKHEDKADEAASKGQGKEVVEGLKEKVKAEDAKDKAAGRQRSAKKDAGDIVKGMKKDFEAGRPLEDMGSYIQRLCEAFVRQGIDKLNPLVDAVHQTLKEHVNPEITRRETMDAISGYGKFRPLNKEAVVAKVRDLKGQARETAKLEDIMAKIPPKKTGQERAVPSDEERRLIQKVREAMRKFGIVSTDPATQLKSALAAVKTRLRNQIADIEYQISTGKKYIDEKTKVRYDAEADALVKHRDELKKQYDDIFSKPELTDEQRIAIAKKATEDSIARYEQKIKDHDFSVRQGKSAPNTPELEALKSRRDALREEFQTLKNADPLIKAAKVEAAEQKARARIDEINQKIRDKDYSTKPKADSPTSETLEGLRAEADDLGQVLQKLRRDAMSPEEKNGIALQAFKTRSKTQLAELQEKTARKDFTAKERKPVILDEEGKKIKAQMLQAKADFQRAKLQDRLAKRKDYEKVADWITRLHRAFLLSGIPVLGKLTVAAMSRMITTPLEEAVGTGWALLPGLADKAQRHTGWNSKAEAKAVTEGLLNYVKNFQHYWDTKGDTLHQLEFGRGREGSIGEKDVQVKSWMDFFGTLHGSLKNATREAEFARSLEKRTQWAIDHDVDVKNEAVQMSLGIAAWKDANRAIFLQDNALVDRFNQFLTARTDKTGHATATGKFAEAAVRSLLPIMRVPTNVVAESMEYALGTLIGGARYAAAIRKGIESLEPEEADGILRQLKKGTIGGAMIALGMAFPQNVGGFYQQGEKRKPGEPKAGHGQIFGVDVPPFVMEQPWTQALQIGATVARVAQAHVNKSNPNQQGYIAGARQAAEGLVEEAPFVREMLDLGAAHRDGFTGFVGEWAKSVIVPQAIQFIATQMDKDQPWPTWQGDTVSRRPKTVLQHIETGLPVARQEVPRAKGFRPPAHDFAKQLLGKSEPASQ